jgi:cytochrome c oxidase cbb3-type subunit 4
MRLLASFAQTWGMLLFIALFLGGVIYALWPKNQESSLTPPRASPLMDNDRPAEAAAGLRVGIKDKAHG